MTAAATSHNSGNAPVASTARSVIAPVAARFDEEGKIYEDGTRVFEAAPSGRGR
jgi:hypothetical protein